MNRDDRPQLPERVTAVLTAVLAVALIVLGGGWMIHEIATRGIAWGVR